jgi:hypothetical protein
MAVAGRDESSLLAEGSSVVQEGGEQVVKDVEVSARCNTSDLADAREVVPFR